MQPATATFVISASLALLPFSVALAEKSNGSFPSWALKAWNETQGPAAASIFALAKRTIIPCYQNQVEGKCPLASRTSSVSVYYTPPYEAPEYAFVVIYFNPNSGNALWFDADIFRRASAARYDHVQSVNGLIGPIDTAKLEGSDFIVTTATLTPGDPRCCASGRTVWRVSIDDGEAHYMTGYKNPDWHLP